MRIYKDSAGFILDRQKNETSALKIHEFITEDFLEMDNKSFFLDNGLIIGMLFALLNVTGLFK